MQHINSNQAERPTDIPEVIDFRVPKSWLDHCKKVHGTACNQRDLALRHFNPMEIVLVDVIEACIATKTTASRYFALSYVWGNAVTTTTTTKNFASFQKPGSLEKLLTLPRTVSDAMVLTRKMGVRYLWVDCLSIVQDSPGKHHDIANMDVIFAQAELTIVAAHGIDANSGLSGVQEGKRRHRVMSKTLGSYTLTLKLPRSQSDILINTTHNSRGWTLQEVLFSKKIAHCYGSSSRISL